MEVKERITQLRKQRGWSLSKLAKEAGISQHAVYNWYNDKNYTPSRNAIEDVCGAFGISLSEFYSDVEVDNLDARQMLLLELFDKVPGNKKDTVIAVVKSFTE